MKPNILHGCRQRWPKYFLPSVFPALWEQILIADAGGIFCSGTLWNVICPGCYDMIFFGHFHGMLVCFGISLLEKHDLWLLQHLMLGNVSNSAQTHIHQNLSQMFRNTFSQMASCVINLLTVVQCIRSYNQLNVVTCVDKRCTHIVTCRSMYSSTEGPHTHSALMRIQEIGRSSVLPSPTISFCPGQVFLSQVPRPSCAQPSELGNLTRFFSISMLVLFSYIVI